MPDDRVSILGTNKEYYYHFHIGYAHQAFYPIDTEDGAFTGG
jgi:hypothetical protein